MKLPWANLQFFTETGYVARVYADSLRDNFVGYEPTNLDRFVALRTRFEQEVAQSPPYLARLLTIEADLVSVMPDDVVVARFWAIDDRFRRVVPLATRDRYDASVPKRGDNCWADARFLRNQSRTLLDVIHANYLLNIGREKSVKRLKTIMGWSALVVLLVLGSLFALAESRGLSLLRALVMLFGAGVFGAFLSITNRMQAAISVDAMTQDGIYELTGLRTGWVGILMSFVLGGGFALVLYGIVMAGLFSVVDPTQPVAAPAGPAPSGPAPASTTPAAGAPPVTAAPAIALAAPVPPVARPKAGDRGAGAPKPDERQPQRCVAGKDARCVDVGGEMAAALGLQGGLNFFRMLVLAFLAGFAERFVPDILNRLSKQGSKAT